MTSLAPLSNAQAYFNRLRELGEVAAFAELEAIPAEYQTNPHFEEEWLDYKREPQSDKDAKKIWSKALSGYANITDGLIIWGIDAKKTKPRDIDAAFALSLVSDPHALESKLRDWVRDATNPPVMGVEYLSLVGPTGAGFVVCLVPESAHKPHRAEWADQYYYYRAGDDFLRAEPALLRVLFYPQLNARFELQALLSYQFHSQDSWNEYKDTKSAYRYSDVLMSGAEIELKVRLRNSGTATAKNCYVRLKNINGTTLLESEQSTYWENLSFPDYGETTFNCNIPIHPGQTIDLFRLKYNKSFRAVPLFDNSDMLAPLVPDINAELFLYAEGLQEQRATITFASKTFDPMLQSVQAFVLAR